MAVVTTVGYSSDVVPEGDSGNKERHQGNVRATYTFDHGEGKSSDLILSYQYGLIPNEDTDRDGDHHAFGLAWHGKLKPWEIKLSYINYEYNLKNPPGQDDSIVQFGYFDTFPITSPVKAVCISPVVGIPMMSTIVY